MAVFVLSMLWYFFHMVSSIKHVKRVTARIQVSMKNMVTTWK